MLADVRLPAGHNGITIDRMARQFAITSSIPLSALRPISCLAGAAARQNPHRRQTTRRFPRVRSSEAFGRRPLHWPINRVRPASETLHVSGRPPRKNPRDTSASPSDKLRQRPQRRDGNARSPILFGKFTRQISPAESEPCYILYTHERARAVPQHTRDADRVGLSGAKTNVQYHIMQ